MSLLDLTYFVEKGILDLTSFVEKGTYSWEVKGITLCLRGHSKIGSRKVQIECWHTKRNFCSPFPGYILFRTVDIEILQPNTECRHLILEFSTSCIRNSGTEKMDGMQTL